MTTRTITAIYDSEADARQARDRLMSVGLDDDDVRIVSQNLSRSSVGGDGTADHDRGMWESIKDFFVGDEDRSTYSEGLRRGGYLLTARVDDQYTDTAISELEQTNAIDLNERSEQWRSEGWSDTSAGYGSTTASLAGTDSDRGISGSDQEQAIPIVEERLRVGKRELDRGGVRVRSYVVEEPVHESVSLRDERVEVERRPASDGSVAGDESLLQDRTIEVSEHSEEAVVQKEAAVKEEVVVRKTADERIENIDDTVRHTEVDVEDTRDTSTPGKSGTQKSSRARGDSGRARR